MLNEILNTIKFGARGDGDVTSVISGNSLVGKNTKPGSTEAEETKMILFNGLYYRGNWAIPFQVMLNSLFLYVNFYLLLYILQQLRSDPGNEFYKSQTEKQIVKLMRARGIFKYAHLDELKAQAIELPYEVNIFFIM